MDTNKQTKYFFFYFKTNALVEVSRAKFSVVKGKVLDFTNFKIRIFGEGNIKMVKRVFSGFKAEGGFESMKLAGKGCKLIYEMLMMLGRARDKIVNVNKVILLELARLILDVSRVFNGKWSGLDLVSLLVSIYIFMEKFQFKAQAMDQFMMAGVSMFLPDSFFKIVQRASVLSGSKLCDDVSIFHSLITCIQDVIAWVFNAFGLPEGVKNSVDKIFNVLCVSKNHILVKKMRLLNEHFKSSSKNYLDKDMNKHCQTLLKEIDNEDLAEWNRRSAGVKEIISRFRLNCKILYQNCDVVRQEPICFVFEGPPATGKSVALNLLLQVLKEPCYAHIVKSMMDGKDFYDTYNNEEIAYFDDMGQQGGSQWRPLINMISVVKMPLDCAAQELKDTKFFNSNKVFVTTNNFSNLQHVISKSDGISDIQALWRRGNVLDFKQVNFVEGAYHGVVQFKYFDVEQKEFLKEWPKSIRKYLETNKLELLPYFHFDETGATGYENKVAFVTWLANVVKVFEKIKAQQLVNNSVSDEFIRKVEDNMFFKAEGGSWFTNLFGTPLNSNDIVNTVNNEPRTFYYDLKVDVDAAQMMTFTVTESATMWWKHLIWDTLIFIYETYLSSVEGMFAAIEDFTNFFFENIIFILILALLATLISSYFFPEEKEQCNVEVEWKGEGKGSLKVLKDVHSSVEFLQKALYPIDIIYGGVKISGTALVSGHCVIVPSHYVAGENVLIRLYKDTSLRNVIVEYTDCSVIFMSRENDLAILQLPQKFPTPFPNLKKHFKVNSSYSVNNSFLVTPAGSTLLGAINAPSKACSLPYVFNVEGVIKYVNNFKTTDFFYTVHGKGMCGSLIVDAFSGIMGMHVAGNEAYGIGVALLWSDRLKKQIVDILEQDSMFAPLWNMSEKVIDGSVVKLDEKVYLSVPSESSFGPSPLYGIYPVEREPADMQYSGKCTVKDIAKKAFTPCLAVNTAELNFGKIVIDSIVEPFDILTEREIVLGNEWLAGLNKDSSNGYQCMKLKSDYIDFEKGEFKEFFRSELELIEESILDGTFEDWDKFIWCETLKDELRDLSKDGEPRSFRVSTIHCQVLTKKYFGKMVENIIVNRENNTIMIGCNPFIEWDKMAHRLSQCEIMFDGDLKRWDGNMVPQVQAAMKEILSKKGSKKHFAILEFLLQNLCTTPLGIQDDLMLTTHSMPSGSFLTAILNSLVNRFYTAMWYKREVGLGLLDFNSSVVDYVYGDDKLVGIVKHSKFLNALSMASFFSSIGLEFTDASKKVVSVPSMTLDEVSFLKRKFIYHDVLGRYMCPLSLKTLQSGLSWVDTKKDVMVVMQDKLHNYQREIYLHPNRDYLLSEFTCKLKNYSINCPILTHNYLEILYNNDPAPPVGWQGMKYL